MNYDFPSSPYLEFEHLSSDMISEFMDDHELSFPELPCQYPTPERVADSLDFTCPLLTKSKDAGVAGDDFGGTKSFPAFDLLKTESLDLEDMNGLEEILTAPQDDLNLEDLLSLFMKPPGENSDDENCPAGESDESDSCHSNYLEKPPNASSSFSPFDISPGELLKSTKKPRKRKWSHPDHNDSRKMSISCLQTQVNSLLNKHALMDSENLIDVPDPKLQQDRLRKMHVQMFLVYHTRTILDRSCWAEVLDEAFVLIAPCAPYSQSNVHIVDNRRKIAGIDAVIKDMIALTAFLESLTNRCSQLKPGVNVDIQFLFHADASEILIAEDKATCHWVLSTQGLTQSGFPSEASVDGMLFCRFTGKHKISSLEMTFDALHFSDQLVALGLIDAAISCSVQRGMTSQILKPHKNTSMQASPLLQMFPFANLPAHVHYKRSMHTPLSPCPKLLPARRNKTPFDEDEHEARLNSKPKKKRTRTSNGEIRRSKPINTMSQANLFSPNSFLPQALLYQHMLNAAAAHQAQSANINFFMQPGNLPKV